MATSRDHWFLVSAYIDSKDLCAAATVSRQWSQLFLPVLWGNPASHFGTEDDAVYVALVRFKRTLAWARLQTRELTHTLHLPPAHPELYDGPHSTWLREMLQRLPCLQSLMVSGLPFFDHGALVALRTNPHSQAIHPRRDATTYPLTLLEASSCYNVTSSGLSENFQHFPTLTYLDLSYTPPARDPAVLAKLSQLSHLRVLKLRGIGLRDSDAAILAQAVDRSVRSLDVRDNVLTDATTDVLLSHCFVTSKQAAEIQARNMAMISGDWPSGNLYSGSADVPDVLKGERQDEHIRKCLTTGFVSFLGLEQVSGTGLTHLYVSGNKLSAVGVAKLLRSDRLHVFDVGSVIPPNPDRHLLVPPQNGGTKALLREVHKLVPALHQHAQGLRYLRMSHVVVTSTVATTDEAEEAMSGASRPMTPVDAVEMDAVAPEIHELPAEIIHELPSDSIVSELDGTPITLAQVNVSEKDELGLKPDLVLPLDLRRASVVAPEVVSPESSTGKPGLSPVSTLHPSYPHTLSPSLNPPQHLRTYSTVLHDHKTRLEAQKAEPHALLPALLPNLQTLVLTDLPPKALNPEVAANLVRFLSRCAEEAHWARLTAAVGYALPPGRNRQHAEATYARSLFALGRVVLEMAPPDARPITAGAPSGTPSKSSVEDADCEAFWSAARGDFTFFGAGDEECGQPEGDGYSLAPWAGPGEKIPVVPEGPVSRGKQARPVVERRGQREPVVVNVLEEVGRFRKEGRRAFADAAARGRGDGYVEGYWDGEVVVIRPR